MTEVFRGCGAWWRELARTGPRLHPRPCLRPRLHPRPRLPREVAVSCAKSREVAILGRKSAHFVPKLPPRRRTCTTLPPRRPRVITPAQRPSPQPTRRRFLLPRTSDRIRRRWPSVSRAGNGDGPGPPEASPLSTDSPARKTLWADSPQHANNAFLPSRHSGDRPA